MKTKIAYEIVSLEAAKIIEKMITATSDKIAEEQWDIYNAYIASCGWTDQELDEECIKNVDECWVKSTN